MIRQEAGTRLEERRSKTVYRRIRKFVISTGPSPSVWFGACHSAVVDLVRPPYPLPSPPAPPRGYHKCTSLDLDYYVRECGEILGVTGELAENPSASTGPMGILDHVFKRLVRFKMLNQVSERTLQGGACPVRSAEL